MPVNAPNDNLDVLAPSFNLKNVDDQMVSLDNTKGLNGTVIVFICNHCPYVKAIASRLKKDADELLEHSINTIAIMSNDVINYPDDSFDNMKIFSDNINSIFPIFMMKHKRWQKIIMLFVLQIFSALIKILN